MISKSTEDIFVARNEIVDSHIHFLNENPFNPKVSLNIHNAKSVLHKCLYRHTLKDTLNL